MKKISIMLAVLCATPLLASRRAPVMPVFPLAAFGLIAHLATHVMRTLDHIPAPNPVDIDLAEAMRRSLDPREDVVDPAMQEALLRSLNPLEDVINTATQQELLASFAPPAYTQQ